MEKEFVPYELAVKLKAIGFDWPCYTYIYTGDTGNNYDHYLEVKPSGAKDWNGKSDLCISRPLFQQAFRWFREKYDFSHSINKTYRGQYMPYVNGEELLDINSEKKVDDNVIDDFGYKWLYDSYEEAEIACLKKLIEIVEIKE
jgi:hypothetical protein